MFVFKTKSHFQKKTVYCHPHCLSGHRQCFKIINDFVTSSNGLVEAMWQKMLTQHYVTCTTYSSRPIIACTSENRETCFVCWFMKNCCCFCMKRKDENFMCLTCDRNAHARRMCISYQCAMRTCGNCPYLPLIQPTLCLAHYFPTFQDSFVRLLFPDTNDRFEICARCNMVYLYLLRKKLMSTFNRANVNIVNPILI